MASSQPFRYIDRSTPATESGGDSTSLGCFPMGVGVLISGSCSAAIARGQSGSCASSRRSSSPPCPSSASVKLILAIANEKSLPLRHFDVAQAHIRASLDEEVYMKLPGGCGEKSGKTTKLERAIYGLKQSGRKWGHLCADTLIEHGFEQCKADPCVFRKVVDGAVVMIAGVYVDDLLIEGSKEDCESLWHL